MKLLSKSRFKIGLECPNKLYFSNKKEYANNKSNDSFLKSLAQGGFQVEELARTHYPDGILIEETEGKYDHKALWEQTKKHLQKENVVLFEPAFLYNNLFIRVDILVKRGNKIKLIEVKAKSYDPYKSYTFVGKRGGIDSTWKPYLYDVAFQNYVMKNCFPNWDIHNYLMLADKSKKATVDGLNQMFRAVEKANKRTGIVTKFKDVSELGKSVLSEIKIDDIINKIQNDDPKFKYNEYLEAYTFDELVDVIASNYNDGTYFNFPIISSACKSCEFKTTEEDKKNNLKSGFEYCFRKQKNWGDSDFDRPLVYEVWNFRKHNKLFDNGIYFMDELTEEDVDVRPLAGKISSSERQWIQVEKQSNNDDSYYVEVQDLRNEMDKWKFPLHFIDFETSMVALPFSRDRHPYEQIAFQFSHHIFHEDGRIEHASEYINTNQGEFPNFEFVRALKRALEKDEGSIFKFANHENTVLNQIYVQLSHSVEDDKVSLMDFIRTITHSRKDSAEEWEGERDMVDLNKVIKDYYYNPLTKGSNSIKAILPAVLNTSEFLKNKYTNSISEINVTSKNFDINHVWLTYTDGKADDPYKTLPPVFENWNEEDLKGLISGMDHVKDGGAALTAYGKLQYTDMSETERQAITKSLLKYCELDTMAMVMIYEHLKEVME